MESQFSHAASLKCEGLQGNIMGDIRANRGPSGALGTLEARLGKLSNGFMSKEARMQAINNVKLINREVMPYVSMAIILTWFNACIVAGRFGREGPCLLCNEGLDRLDHYMVCGSVRELYCQCIRCDAFPFGVADFVSYEVSCHARGQSNYCHRGPHF